MALVTATCYIEGSSITYDILCISCSALRIKCILMLVLSTLPVESLGEPFGEQFFPRGLPRESLGEPFGDYFAPEGSPGEDSPGEPQRVHGFPGEPRGATGSSEIWSPSATAVGDKFSCSKASHWRPANKHLSQQRRRVVTIQNHSKMMNTLRGKKQKVGKSNMMLRVLWCQQLKNCEIHEHISDGESSDVLNSIPK